MDRDELHDLVMSLNEKLKAGRLVLRDPVLLRELSAVRLAEDGKIDAASVGSQVRAAARASAGADVYRAMKQISLQEVQTRYFEILDNNFGSIFSEMKRRGLDPQQLARVMATQDRVVDAFMSDLQEFTAGLAVFWDVHGPIVELHLRDQRTLKTVFGGDVFPSYTNNIACSVGLYADTIVLPDPLHSLTTYAESLPPKELFRLALKHALNALSYRELALAPLDVPIVVFAPDYVSDKGYRSVLESAAEADMLQHFSAIFGIEFSSQAELDAFLNPLPDCDSILKHAVDPGRILFDVGSTEPFSTQFSDYARDFLKNDIAATKPGFVLRKMLYGRLLVVNDAVLRSNRFGGNPLIDAPTSWRYFQWKNEYREKSILADVDARRDALIAKAISLDGRQHKMLNGIPTGSLIELRKNGALAELREIIRRGIGDVESTSESDLTAVGNHVIGNIDSALDDHAKQLERLASERRKFYGFDVSRWMGSSALSIASLLFPHYKSQIEDVKKAVDLLEPPPLKEILTRHKEMKSESARLKLSPAGIMFRHLKKNFGFS